MSKRTTGIRIRRQLSSLSIVLILMNGPFALADCPDMSSAQPARLIDSEAQDKLISGLVSKWKTEEPARLIKFGAYVSETGRLEGACCMSSTHRMSAGASRRLGSKIDRLKFIPASNSGETMDVFVAFTIIAKKTPDGVQTELVLNHLHSMKEFGVNYSSPQRIWRQQMAAGRRASGSMNFEVHTIVDQFGHATDAKVSENESRHASIDGAVLSRIESSCFIPGTHNGEPVEMLYSEGFTNY